MSPFFISTILAINFDFSEFREARSRGIVVRHNGVQTHMGF